MYLENLECWFGPLACQGPATWLAEGGVMNLCIKELHLEILVLGLLNTQTLSPDQPGLIGCLLLLKDMPVEQRNKCYNMIFSYSIQSCSC